MAHYDYLKHIGKPVKNYQLFFKRIFDLIFGFIFFIISLPIVAVFAILIKLDSKGPVFFRQKRVGYMGKPFYIIKLRSMKQNAEAKTGAIWARKNDPRVTKIGKFMREKRIDELPQFWNVLKGDMSMVGPRPERPMLTEQFYQEYPWFPKRLRIKPGITGYAQVNGGYDIGPDLKSRYDNYYIKHYSLWLDLKIFFKTISVICTGNGAR